VIREGNFIYVLHHDNSDFVYIGMSTSGLRRPEMHGKPAYLRKHGRLPVVQWIKKRIKHGETYKIAVLETCATKHELPAAEQFYISSFRGMGFKLLNCTGGGEGAIGNVVSSETKARMSSAAKGRIFTAEHRKNISIAHSNRTKDVRDRTAASLRLYYIHNGVIPAHVHAAGSLVVREWRLSLRLGQKATERLLGLPNGAIHRFERDLPSAPPMPHGRSANKSICRRKLPAHVIATGPAPIRAWRLSLGLRQADLARLVGVSVQTISAFEQQRYVHKLHESTKHAQSTRARLPSTKPSAMRGKAKSAEWKAKISAGHGGSMPPHMLNGTAATVLQHWRLALGLDRPRAASILGISAKALEHYESRYSAVPMRKRNHSLRASMP
jgi:DNA-binding XRE family transcriptional regulator